MVIVDAVIRNQPPVSIFVTIVITTLKIVRTMKEVKIEICRICGRPNTAHTFKQVKECKGMM